MVPFDTFSFSIVLCFYWLRIDIRVRRDLQKMLGVAALVLLAFGANAAPGAFYASAPIIDVRLVSPVVTACFFLSSLCALSEHAKRA